VAVKSSGDFSAEPVRGQKIEEHVVTDLDVRNDENKPSLTSGAVAEERQEVSSKNTIDGLADAIIGGKDIGLWLSNIPEKMRECCLKNENLFFNMMLHNTEKTETRHGNAPKILFLATTTTPKSLKEAGFAFLFHKLVFIVSRVDWRAQIRLNVRISWLEKASATRSTLRSHEQSVEHKDATIAFSRRCN